MKILMVIPHDIYYEPWTTRPVELAEAFVRMGHDVTLYYWPVRADPPRFPRTRVEAPRGVRTVAAVGLHSKYYANLRRLVHLARDVDVVEFQKCLPYCSMPSLFCARILGKPVCYDWDDNESAIVQEWQPSSTFGGCVYALERLLPRFTTTLCVSSQALKDKARSLGVSEDCIFEAPVGAALERFDPEDRGAEIRERYAIDGPLVVYMGQLQGASYGELFLRAVGIVAKKWPGAYFMVVGGGERLAMLRSASEALGLGSRLTFTDYVPHEQIPTFLAAADIGVATFARNESTVCKSPLKIVEYLAAGRPIVASDVGEIRKMVGDAGIVVRPGDPGAIAEGVSRLLGDDRLRARLSLLARRRAKEVYNWDATARSMLAAFSRALELGPGCRPMPGFISKRLDKGIALTQSNRERKEEE